MDIFQQLNGLNVNEFTEKKNNLTYLSWAHAWAEFKKVCPTATYEIKSFNGGLPYVYDPNTGYMVFTSVTVGVLTHDMWLPVMDGANKSMKHESYTYDTKFKKGLICEAATMFDINKTIMRCLVKNLAMFGLGLYIYAGEDLPDGEETQKEITKVDEKVLAEVKAKWQLLAGNTDGFQKFYDDQTAKGVTLEKMNTFLANKIKEKGDKKDE